ncbi:hypothetical protein TNCV_1541151 [Trichonephila clavipes]|nr:hypothetical protein TNCV_1541151 [Trichonephila clavipes]
MLLRNRTQLTSRIKRSRPIQSSQLFVVEWTYVFSDERFSGKEYPFVHSKLPRSKKERTFRCPGNKPSGDHVNQDCATTGV